MENNTFKKIRTMGIKRANFDILIKAKTVEEFEDMLTDLVTDDKQIGRTYKGGFVRIPSAIYDMEFETIVEARELAMTAYVFTYGNLHGHNNFKSLDELNKMFGTSKKRITEFGRDLFKKFNTGILEHSYKRTTGHMLSINQEALMSFCEENDGVIEKEFKKEVKSEVIETVKEIAVPFIATVVEEIIETPAVEEVAVIEEVKIVEEKPFVPAKPVKIYDDLDELLSGDCFAKPVGREAQKADFYRRKANKNKMPF